MNPAQKSSFFSLVSNKLQLALPLLLVFAAGCEVYPAAPGPVVTSPLPPVVSAPPASTSYTPTSVGQTCGVVSDTGQCSSNILEFCHDGMLYTYACSDYGLTCGFDADHKWYDCLNAPAAAPNAPSNPAPQAGTCSAGYEGNCKANTLSFCVGEETQTADCTELGAVCAWDETFERFDCIVSETTTPGAPTTAPTPEPTPSGACGDITYEGQCAESVLTWCEDDAIQTAHCDGVCGWNEEKQFYDCLDSATPPRTSNCGDVTSEGKCDGNVLSYCEDGGLVEMTCDNICGWDEDKSYYGCLDAETPQPTEGCGELTTEGTCDGKTLKWCEDGAAQELACDNACGWNEEKKYNDCIDAEAPTPTEGCGELTTEGVCEGKTLKWCAEGVAKELLCDNACGWNEDKKFNDCLEAEAPQPAKTCGDVTSEGQCEGKVLTFCKDGALETLTCENECGWNEEKNFNDCL